MARGCNAATGRREAGSVEKNDDTDAGESDSVCVGTECGGISCVDVYGGAERRGREKKAEIVVAREPLDKDAESS